MTEMEQLARSDPRWRCREISSQNEALWWLALSRGCLSKALNDKDLLYSHHKAVSGWQLGRSNLFPDPDTTSADELGDEGKGQQENGEEEEDVLADNLAEAGRKFQPLLLSPVILEDLTAPPEAVEDAAPALFSLHELLAYLTSPEWAYTVRLRVVGGDLLRTLNNALLSLEKRRLVDVHSVHANANNRVRRPRHLEEQVTEGQQPAEQTAQKQEPAAQEAEEGKGKGKAKGKKQKGAQFPGEDAEASSNPVTRIPSAGQEALDSQLANQTGSIIQVAEAPAVEKKLELPKPYLTDPEYEYEKLDLEIIYYEKCAKSNIPYLIPDFDELDLLEELPVPKTLPRPLLREPYAHRAYRTEKIRLPASENFGMGEHIALLESELVELKMIEEEKIEEAKRRAATAKEEKAKDAGKKDSEQDDRSFLKSGPDVEYIADNPHLEPTQPEEKPPDVSKKASSKMQSERRKSSAFHKMDERDSMSIRSSKMSSPRIGGSPPVVDKPFASQSNGRSLEIPEDSSSDHTLMNVSRDEGGSFSSLGATWESLESIEEEESESFSLQEQLILTREELYVSGLYAAREENRRAAEEKLEERRRARAKERTLVAKRVLESAVKRAKGDLYSSFKHLAKKREAERIRATRPKVTQIPRSSLRATAGSQLKKPHKDAFKTTLNNMPGSPHQIATRSKQKDVLQPLPQMGFKLPQVQSKQSPSKPPLPGITGKPTDKEGTEVQESGASAKTLSKIPLRNPEEAEKWEFYRREQDRCEMDAALDNTLEGGVLERMPKRNFYPNYVGAEKSAKSKGEKNKSQNKNYDRNENRFTQNKGDQKNTVLRKKYPAHNLFLSAYGNTMKITQPGVKANIIKSGFRVDKYGNPQRGSKQPPLRRIGFTSPGNLMKYLINIRNAVQRNVPPIAWRAFKCNKNGQSVRQEQKEQNFNALSGLQQKQRTDALNRDSNSSGRSQESRVCDSRRSLLGELLENRNTHHSGVRLKASVIKKTQQDVNKSAVSESSPAPEKRHSEGGSTKTDWAIHTETEAGAGAEAKGEGEEEDAGDANEREAEPTELALTVSEILERDLQCYGEACSCDECAAQADMLAHLRPKGHVFIETYGCPPVLGRLRRDFNFLQEAPRASGGTEDPRRRLDASGRVVLPKHPPILDVFQIGEHLLEVMDDVMIRKEVLCSSRGFNYVTITFTQRRKDTAAHSDPAPD